MQHTTPAERLADRADDVRREAKSVMRRMRVLTQLAAEMEKEATALADEATEKELAQHPVDY